MLPFCSCFVIKMVQDENTGAKPAFKRRTMKMEKRTKSMQAYAVIKEFAAFALLSLAGYVCLVVA